jgi:hypothetical protein
VPADVVSSIGPSEALKEAALVPHASTPTSIPDGNDNLVVLDMGGSSSIQYRHELRGRRVDAAVHGAGAPDDAGARLLLRRDGPVEERAQQDDDAIPHLLFMAYQGTFAIITVAIISGAVVEHMRFGAYLAFMVVWVLAVYAPVAHWVWGGGFLAASGALDFAGGAVVHVNAAAAALVAALVVGPRKDYGRHAMLPHNVPFTLLGTGLLWFGWFGFNAGSALSVGPTAAARVRQHAAGPRGGALGLDPARPAPRRACDGGGRRHRHRRGAGGGDTRGRIRRPGVGAGARAIGAVPSYVALIYRACNAKS